MYGKHYEGFPKYKGGEEEWQEWSGDYKIMVDTRNEVLGEAMELVMRLGKTEAGVIDWRECKQCWWKMLEASIHDEWRRSAVAWRRL